MGNESRALKAFYRGRVSFEKNLCRNFNKAMIGIRPVGRNSQ